MLYFWKAKGPRTSKMIFWTVRYTNTQIQIHKYTNTACDEVPEIPNMCYIFEKPRVQGHQTWYSGLSDTQIHKYTNTACDEVLEIPNMCYIFEKPKVQGYQTWCFGLSYHKYTRPIPAKQSNLSYNSEYLWLPECIVSI